MSDASFFDTSALVKRYYEESGTDTVDSIIEDDDAVVITSDRYWFRPRTRVTQFIPPPARSFT